MRWAYACSWIKSHVIVETPPAFADMTLLNACNSIALLSTNSLICAHANSSATSSFYYFCLLLSNKLKIWCSFTQLSNVSLHSLVPVLTEDALRTFCTTMHFLFSLHQFVLNFSTMPLSTIFHNCVSSLAFLSHSFKHHFFFSATFSSQHVPPSACISYHHQHCISY